MKPDSFREKAIFNAAVELSSPAERAALLERECAGDAELRAAVEALLRADAEATEKFLDSPAGPTPQRVAATIRITPLETDDYSNQTIGRYKLLEKIGEGGFGAVYVAEQTEPVRRRVALKLIKLGMDTKQVVARFEAERQALAMMDHPNIAKVLDGGATEAGRPYFVMELVRGIRITDYCDQNNLGTKERLDLFIKVCQAIQHAHQKGIIHRDIKPSNILVTLNDGVPVPKVIDFGIAKATEGRLTDATVYTQLHQFMGTPAYMSPEQAEMSSLDIDTRSDIYSLGVLLYELLAGSTPFDAEKLMASGIDAMRKTIREQEPQRPSTKLAALKHEEQTSTARRRSSEAPKLIRQLSGDLDWIVMKCLEKDRTRRYETANGLATDLNRHLQNEPVTACPPSAAYRLRKTFQRNRLAFAASATIVVVLLAGLSVSIWQAVRATRAERAQTQLRKQAEAETARSKQVSLFLEDMLKSAGPAVAQGRDSTMLREILDKTAKRLETSLKDQPEVRAQLLRTLGETYRQLEDRVKSEAMHRESLNLRRSIFKGDHPDLADSLLKEATALMRLVGMRKNGEASRKEAEDLTRESMAMRERLYGQTSWQVADAVSQLARLLKDQGRTAEAESLYRDNVARRSDLRGGKTRELASDLNGLAGSLSKQGRFDESLPLNRRALEMIRVLNGDAHPSTFSALNEYAFSLQAAGDLKTTESVLREADAIALKIYPPETARQNSARQKLMVILRAQGRTEAIAELERDAAKPTEQSSPVAADANKDTADWSDAIALAEMSPTATGSDAGKASSASDSEIVRLAQSVKPDDLLLFVKLTALLVEGGDLAGFREICHTTLEKFSSTQDAKAARRVSKACLLAPLPSSDTDAAARLAEFALTRSTEPKFSVQANLGKGLAEYRLGHFAGAIEWMGKVLADPQPNSPIKSQLNVAAKAVIAAAQHRLGKVDAARASLQQAQGALKAARAASSTEAVDANWQDTLVAQLLLSEARQTIEGSTAVK